MALQAAELNQQDDLTPQEILEREAERLNQQEGSVEFSDVLKKLVASGQLNVREVMDKVNAKGPLVDEKGGRYTV